MFFAQVVGGLPHGFFEKTKSNHGVYLLTRVAMVVLVDVVVKMSPKTVVPFVVLDLVCRNDVVVLFGVVAFGEGNWSVVRCFNVPFESCALEGVVHLVERVVIDVESVECTGGEWGFVCVVRLVNQL